ncbi:hypothetical protein Tco_0387845, partial [Tanacetum coccineum]
KPLDIRKFDSSSYQALGACFNPYKAFLRRLEKTCVSNASKRATGANDSSKSIPSS